jgi:hypothetical protein
MKKIIQSRVCSPHIHIKSDYNKFYLSNASRKFNEEENAKREKGLYLIEDIKMDMRIIVENIIKNACFIVLRVDIYNDNQLAKLSAQEKSEVVYMIDLCLDNIVDMIKTKKNKEDYFHQTKKQELIKYQYMMMLNVDRLLKYKHTRVIRIVLNEIRKEFRDEYSDHFKMCTKGNETKRNNTNYDTYSDSDIESTESDIESDSDY